MTGEVPFMLGVVRAPPYSPPARLRVAEGANAEDRPRFHQECSEARLGYRDSLICNVAAGERDR